MKRDAPHAQERRGRDCARQEKQVSACLVPKPRATFRMQDRPHRLHNNHPYEDEVRIKVQVEEPQRNDGKHDRASFLLVARQPPQKEG